MKIRIKDNSLRLRLTQSEVNKFQEVGVVESSISFPNGNSLKYFLIWNKTETFDIDYTADVIKVSVPFSKGKKWLSPSEVGVSSEFNLEHGQTLKLLIEKDFACLTAREDEDESDNFPNPLSNC